MQTQKTHWPSIIVLIILTIGLFFFLGITLVMSLVSVIDLFNDSGLPADYMIIAFSTASEFALLLACAWFVLQKVMGREAAGESATFSFSNWLVFFIPLIGFIAISIGTAVAIYANQYLNWFILPTTTLLVIIPPILFYIGLGSNGIEAGSRWRIWGTIGLGLTIGPLLMIVLELLVLVLAIVAVALVLSFQSGKIQEIQAFFQLLNQQTNEEATLRMMAPYLSDPRLIAALLGYIALIVPLIEEMLKPLAVWLFAKSIAKPSQGFVLGMLSGGAFALVESLNASAESSEAWPFAVGVRAGTSLLHIMLSGLMGYAIVGAFQEKRFGRLILTYLTVVSIHGIWNAAAVAAGLSVVGESLGKPEWLVTYLPASIGGILVLGMGMFFVLLASNRKVRAELTPAPVLTPAEDQE